MLRKLNYAVIGIVITVLAYEYGAPYYAILMHGEEFKTLMYRCDSAMRDHYIAKKAVEYDTTKKNVENLEAAELALMNCHEYDKLRKELQRFNVSKAMLEGLGLMALEEKEYELNRFVKAHEFRY
jgi:hypothetical protein